MENIQFNPNGYWKRIPVLYSPALWLAPLLEYSCSISVSISASSPRPSSPVPWSPLLSPHRNFSAMEISSAGSSSHACLPTRSTPPKPFRHSRYLMNFTDMPLIYQPTRTPGTLTRTHTGACHHLWYLHSCHVTQLYRVATCQSYASLFPFVIHIIINLSLTLVAWHSLTRGTLVSHHSHRH